MVFIQPAVPKDMVTSTITHNSQRTKSLKTLIKMHSNVLKTSNLAYVMLLEQGRVFRKTWFCVCKLAVSGSQGIVVKCTAATDLFPYNGLVNDPSPKWRQQISTS